MVRLYVTSNSSSPRNKIHKIGSHFPPIHWQEHLPSGMAPKVTDALELIVAGTPLPADLADLKVEEEPKKAKSKGKASKVADVEADPAPKRKKAKKAALVVD